MRIAFKSSKKNISLSIKIKHLNIILHIKKNSNSILLYYNK